MISSDIFRNDLRRERRVKRQRPVNTKFSSEKPTTTKSLSARYAELLKLREAVSKTQAHSKTRSHSKTTDSEISSNVERPVAKEARAFPYH
jgi:hypothetical protein